MIKDNNRNRFTLYGALFGLCFPIISFLIITLISPNIWTLFSVICSAPLFLGLFARLAGVRQDKINEVNLGLEKTVEERTRAIKNMLDVTGQGFLSFGPDLKIKNNYSKKCEQIFTGKIPGKKINDLLFENSEAKHDFEDGIALLFNGKAKGEVIFDLMEKEVFLQGKSIKIEYRVISEQEILCILTDITSEKILEKTLEKENEDRSIILQVISHQKYFSSFVQEADRLFLFMSLLDKSGTKKDFEKLQRDIHTFKGNASFFSFNKSKETAHELEYYINDCLILEETINLEEQSPVMKKSYYSELKIIQDTLGDQWIKDIDNVTIPRKNYLKLEQYIGTKYKNDSDLNNAVRHFRKIPMRNMFARFPDMADRLAVSLGKKINPVVIEGGQNQILPEQYETLVNSFVHLLRNMMDHGVEKPRERELINKREEGNIYIGIEIRNNEIHIVFSDDGKGIQLGVIEKKARDKNLIDRNRKINPGELIKLIFSQDFSTSEEITDISGRGAGLSAVKNEVDKLKGRISVSTRQNQGTTFKIIIPEAT